MTRAEMVRRYAAGENLRQIGDAAGRSHEAVRLNLLAEGVALRPRCSGTPRTPRISTLADEIAEDLGRWPEGASMSDLREWLGGMAECQPHQHEHNYVAFVLSLTPDDVIQPNGSKSGPLSREEWRYIQCAQRLAWEYGIERAALILDGSDPATQTDLAAWRSLGARKATEVRA